MSQIGADVARLRASAQLMRATADQVIDRSGTLVREMDALAAVWTGIARDRCGMIWGTVVPNFQVASELLHVYAAQLDSYAAALEAEERRRNEGGGFLKKVFKGAIKGLRGVGSVLGDITKVVAFFTPAGPLLAISAALQLPSRIAEGGFRGAIGGLGGVFGEQLGIGKNVLEQLTAQGVRVPEGQVSPGGYHYGVATSLFNAQGNAWTNPDLMTIGADGRVELGRVSASGAFGNELIGGSGSAEIRGPSAEGHAVLSWDPSNPYAVAEGRVTLGSVSVNGELHSPLGDLVGSASAEGPSAHARVAITPGQIGGEVGVSAGSAQATVDTNLLGTHWGAGVEVGLKAELGVEVGERVAIKLPFVSFEASGSLASTIPGLREVGQVGEQVGAVVAAGETVVGTVKGAFKQVKKFF